MMETTIRLRNFKLPRAKLLVLPVTIVAGLALAFSVDNAALAVSVKAPQLPVLHNIGIVPISVEEPEGSDDKLTERMSFLGQIYPQAVRETRRFRALNDQVVADLWLSEPGRKELIEQFELEAYIGLTASVRSDVVTMTVRLMDDRLKPLLTEQDRVAREWLLGATDDDIKDRVESLIFALVNRLPVDVSVTSIHGAYATISGGQEQGLSPGDKVELKRVKIKGLHPADGTWVAFTETPVGSGTVIESKSHNSVLRIDSQISANAIQVGDGARIGAIKARNKFVRLADSQGFKDAGMPSSIIVPPLYYGRPPDKAPPSKGFKPAASNKSKDMAWRDDNPPPTAGAAPEEPSEAPESTPAPRSTNALGPEKSETGSGDDSDFLDALKSPNDKWIDDMTVYTGPHWWSMKGMNASTSGKFPLWLLNSFGASITRTIILKIKTQFGGGVLFGQTTNKGSFVGYDAFANLHWEETVSSGEGLITFWRAGGMGSFSGMAVSKEKYGGGDFLRGGGFFGLGGTILTEAGAEQAWDWTVDIGLLPLNIGRFGYSGKQHLVESAFGTRGTITLLQHRDAGILQWGGGLDISDERLTLKNSRRPHLTDYRLKLLCRYSF